MQANGKSADIIASIVDHVASYEDNNDEDEAQLDKGEGDCILVNIISKMATRRFQAPSTVVAQVVSYWTVITAVNLVHPTMQECNTFCVDKIDDSREALLLTE